MDRAYIAGPVAGRPDLNRPAFRAAAVALSLKGYEPVNPHDIPPWQHEGPCPPSYAVSDSGHSTACHLRTCMAAVCGCDVVVLLPGWMDSTGANYERALAEITGIPRLLYPWLTPLEGMG